MVGREGGNLFGFLPKEAVIRNWVVPDLTWPVPQEFSPKIRLDY